MGVRVPEDFGERCAIGAKRFVAFETILAAAEFSLICQEGRRICVWVWRVGEPRLATVFHVT